MNIMLRHPDPDACAALAHWRHTWKMAIEAMQVLSAVRIGLGLDAPYKLSHAHHPITLWTGRSREHYAFTLRRARSLLDEYSRRYNKVSAPLEAAYAALIDIPDALPSEPITSYCVCRRNQPTVYVETIEEAVVLYRQYLGIEVIT